MQILPILERKNPHSRDVKISFEEKDHKYTILEQGTSSTPYISTTTFIHKQFEEFNADIIIKNMMNGRNWNSSKYFGMSVEEIKTMWNNNGNAVSKEGTNLHNRIENFMNQSLSNPTVEYTHKTLLENYHKNNSSSSPVSEDWKYFLKYVEELPDFKPFRTEWLIYDEEVKIAGSIDMVYKNEDGTLNIYDWKRSKKITKETFGNKFAMGCINHIPDANYFHYSLQLNIYKKILEKNYGVKVRDLFLVRLHPENEKYTYDLIKVIDLSSEVEDLFKYRKTQLVYDTNEKKIVKGSNKIKKNKKTSTL